MLSVARTSYGELVCSLGGYGEQVRQLDQLVPTLPRLRERVAGDHQRD